MATYLGADDVVVSRMRGELLAQSNLGESRTIERGGVEVASTGLPGRSTVAAASSSGISRNMLPRGAAPNPSGPRAKVARRLMIAPLSASSCQSQLCSGRAAWNALAAQVLVLGHTRIARAGTPSHSM